MKGTPKIFVCLFLLKSGMYKVIRYLSTFSEVQYEANFVRYDINKIMFFSTQTVLDRGYCKTTCRVYAAWLHLARPNIVLGKSPRNVIEKEEQYQIHFKYISFLCRIYCTHTISTPALATQWWWQWRNLIHLRFLPHFFQLPSLLPSTTTVYNPKQLYLIYDAYTSQLLPPNILNT